MSMRDYAVNDYGVVFTEEMLKEICKCKDVNTDVYDLAEKIGLEFVSEFTGEATRIYTNGEFDYKTSVIYNDDVLYYLPLYKSGTLFKPAYKCIEEVVEEVTERIGAHLPDDFDYNSNIRSIVGTYYG